MSTATPVITIYNTLSRQKEPLQVLHEGKIGMYVCGPTVYDDCHIGHLMGPVLFDSVARWLQFRGYEVSFVNNITDVDDKIIKRSIDTGEDWLALTQRYTQQYFDFLAELHVNTVTKHPLCSAYIPKMVAYIQDLVDADTAYPVSNGVYYDVAQNDAYGKLSGRKIDDMIAGSRVAVDSELRHPADFCLWKAAKEGEPSWDSPWGAGRPGWHIECSVMATDILGERFDIHGGGDDLKFPHHENEIAQSESHSGCYANTWMHNGLIQYEGVKIGKSDPRMKDPEFSKQFNARYLLDTYSPAVMRFFLLQGHYRRPFDFAPKNIAAAGVALAKIHKQLGPIMSAATGVIERSDLDAELQKLRNAFCAAMDDDFNTGSALGQVFSLAAVARKRTGAEQVLALELLRDCGRVLGLFEAGDEINAAKGEADDETVDTLMDIIIVLRQQARARRDFESSDAIRDQLAHVNIVIKDSKDGAQWERS